jgi:feruloyl esterase
LKQRRQLAAVLCAVVLTSSGGAAFAQHPQGYFEEWKDNAAAKAPKLSCRDVRSLTGYDYAIDESTLVPAKEPVPEFCHVQGLIQPEVRFDLTLPRAWNGRLYMIGNGGFAGENLQAAARVTRRDAALARGFAVVSTNTGHNSAREPLATFAASPQKLVDYAYRAVHVTAMTAKDLARAYYGTAPARAYFDGCSTGGRQGLISAQRFPDDFDGIIVGAPVLDFSGTMLFYAKLHQAARSAPRLVEKMPMVAAKVYEKCDALDGASDGLIEDPRGCRFDPSTDVPRCASVDADAACVTSEEVAAMQAVYGNVSVGGADRFPGFPVGAEAGAPGGPSSGWMPWIVTPEGKGMPISRTFMETFFKHMVTPGAEVDWTALELEKSPTILGPISTLLDATDPDLSRFRARKGKILMYFGWADPALNPLMGIRYYERVREAMGPSTTDFFRLFMMPGVFHCQGGPGPDRGDMITTLVRWVEQGTAPERILASKRQGEKITRTRPLCVYPQVAKYKGTGSLDDAASFTCSAPSR